MMKNLQFFAKLLAIVLLTISHTVQAGTSIKGSLQVPDEYRKAAMSNPNMENYKNIFYKNVKVYLEGSPGTSKIAYPVVSTGKFAFHNIEPGHSYILSAESPNMRYRSVRVDVNKNGGVRVREADRIDTARVSILPTQIKLQPLGRPMFFEERKKINIMQVLMGNPMVLIMLFGGGMMFLMPKMVDMDDPEVKKELENNMGMFGKAAAGGGQQQQMPDMAEMMSNLFSGGAAASAVASKSKKKK